MKKQKQVKRVVSKNGQIRFYQDGKRLTDKKAVEILSKQSKERQRRAKESAKELLYYKGKALSKSDSYLLRLALQEKVKDEKRLDKIQRNDGTKFFRTKAELNRLIDQQAKSLKNFFVTENVYLDTKDGKSGKISKRGSMDLGEFLLKGAFSQFKVTLIDDNFQYHRGKVSVMSAIADFELRIMMAVTEADQNMGVHVTFDYRFEVSTTLRTIIIDITPEDPSPMSMVIQDAVDSQQNVITFWKDVTIRIGYS